MSNTSNRNCVLGCGRCWEVGWEVGRLVAVGSLSEGGRTEAAGVREGGTAISWLLRCGEGP